MERPDSRFVTLGGVQVHYLQAGEGPTVLLVHGLGASVATWRQNIDPLAAAGYRVLALDLPGHGDSDKPRDLSYDPVAGAELLLRFLRSQDVQQASVVGSSAGGLVVSLFALAYPELVEKVVLVASGGLGRRVSWLLRAMSVPGLGELMYHPKLRNFDDLSRYIFFQPPPFLEEVLREMIRLRNLPGSRRATLKGVRSSVNLFGLRQRCYILHRLKGLSKPMLTVWGEEDRILPVSHAATVRRELPQTIVRVIPRCGHWPHMERAEEFNELLLRFLRGSLDRNGDPTGDPTGCLSS
jgi:pimeloyl-ACP methyl ester carboxylesterase